MFVGCKKQAQEAIKEAALACGQFYVNQRWLGGTLTNLATIRKSIDFAKELDVETIQVSLGHPFPGTEFYDHIKKNGLITIDEKMTDDAGH